jgi:hypothetical protein
MSTYQELKGLKIKYLSADTSGDRKVDGEVFYNSTDFNLKSFVATAAWHSTANLTHGRASLAAAGTVPAGLVFGGAGVADMTEEYNGSGSSNGGGLNTARQALGGAGTQTAAAKLALPCVKLAVLCQAAVATNDLRLKSVEL